MHTKDVPLKRYHLATGMAALFLSTIVAAISAHAADISIDAAVAHVLDDSVNGRRVEIYMNITNAGTARDRLYAVRTKLSGKAMLSVVHESDHSGSADGHDAGGHAAASKHMQMSVLDVAAGGTATLRQGGSHIMLMEPTATPAVGSTFPVTLFFERAGRITVDVMVEPREMGY